VSLGVPVVEGLVHRVHDVLKFLHLEVVLGADQRPLSLEFVDQSSLLLTELQTQLVDPLPLQIYNQKSMSEDGASVLVMVSECVRMVSGTNKEQQKLHLVRSSPPSSLTVCPLVHASHPQSFSDLNEIWCIGRRQ